MKYIVQVGDREVEVVLAEDGVTVDGEAVHAHLAEEAGVPVRLLAVGNGLHRVMVRRGDARQAEQRAGFLLPEDRGQLPPGLRGIDERDPECALVGHPGPQRRQRRRRGQLIQTSQHRWAQPAPPRPARKQQSGVQHILSDRIINGEAEAYGSSRPNK